MSEKNRPKRPSPLILSTEALWRYSVVSEVRAKILGGMSLADAVRQTATTAHVRPSGDAEVVSTRSIYRWFADFKIGGVDELETARPAPSDHVSKALCAELVEFLRSEKSVDRYASVPELIRRAREHGIIKPGTDVDRTTAWRACKRMELPMRRVPAKSEGDTRRWAYPHRMMMTLADGKKFRAGAARLRRVALFFLDDATRYGLDVVVGTEECARLFLRGFYSVIRRTGLMLAIFLDGGAGFIADDTFAVCRNLGLALIHGTARYPQGHGKIERFNQTTVSQVLRGLVGAADVDPDCGALELRLRHFLLERYNRQPHESLGGMTPQERWDADTRALDFPDDDRALRSKFIVTETRKVSADHIIPYEGLDYEVPRGHARATITVYRQVLEDGPHLCVLHDGRLVRIHPVDLAQNAITRRARPQAPPPDDDEGTPKTAAQLSFSRDFGPITGPDGGFPAAPKPSTKGRPS
jgi:transposase InsO family protein